MNSKKKHEFPKLFEFRIKYNPSLGASSQYSYHYFNAKTALEALNFHLSTMKKRNLNCEVISIEKNNPYSNKWDDETPSVNK
jgi:hypothetical protein